ncbi:MAG: hypothetical protein CL908_25325 [Deltaproteobacteria bacterium]|nr:hypothetical protein [Deltaproteobacteria bacterium]
MKRANDAVVGRPTKVERRQREVAGVNLAPVSVEVASYRHALTDPMATAADDAALIADFAEFLSGDDELDEVLLVPPDPTFREKLRRRVWRTYVQTHLRDSGDAH